MLPNAVVEGEVVVETGRGVGAMVDETYNTHTK